MARMSKAQFTKNVLGQCSDLQRFWNSRNQQFKDWYDLLSLVDENKTGGLESFTSNDPRTTFNMALFLLSPDTINVNIPIDQANDSEAEAISATESAFAAQWKKLDKASYKAGQQGWLRYVNSLMLATGWYSVFSLIDEDEFIADVWNPAQTYPWFDTELGEVAHIYKSSISTVKRKAAKNNWDISFRDRMGQVDVYDYWCYDDYGLPRNIIIIDDKLVKDQSYDYLQCLPVYCSPINGLPDTGVISQNSNEWKKHLGESILATNADVTRSYNRLLTFLIQLAKDVAQAPIIERSEGAGVVQSSDIGKRAIVWKVGKDTIIETLATGGIPPEIPLQLQNMRAMLQRGGFADGLFTGVDGSGYLQSLVSASSQQILKPFNNGINHLLSDINNGWLYQLRNQDIQVNGQPLDISLPQEAQFEIEIEVSIPGDLIQRATTARQLAPSFALSNTTTIDLLFPEIKDPNRELILARKDKAMNSEVMAMIDLSEALKEQADSLEADGLTEQAQSYRQWSEQASQSISAALGGQPAPQGAPGIGNAGRQ